MAVSRLVAVAGPYIRSPRARVALFITITAMTPTITHTRKTYTQTTLTPSSSSSSKTKQPKPVIAKSNSDVLLCIKPEFATLIREGKKNHEYRKY